MTRYRLSDPLQTKMVAVTYARQLLPGTFEADAMVATIGSAQEFRNGRQLAAWLGLVPTQHSSDGIRDWERSVVGVMRISAPC